MTAFYIPASSILCANVIPSATVASDDQIVALDAPLANELDRSAVDVLQIDIEHYRYEKLWLSVGYIADPTFALRDIQSSQVKSQVASKGALAFDYLNVVISATWSLERNPTDSIILDAIEENDGRKVTKEGCKIILVDGRHCCSALRQQNGEDRHE